MSKLNIDQQTIYQLFSDKKSDFLIPDYQRPYAWGDTECQTLWDDDFSFGRGPAAKGRERETWGNDYYEPTEDDYINWDTSGDEKYYSGKKGYVIAGSDTEILDKNSVKNLSDEDLRLAINEIYARHGRKFKSEELQKYFDNKAWYTPKYEPDEFDKKQNSILNDVEKKNLKTLTEIRSERGN